MIELCQEHRFTPRVSPDGNVSNSKNKCLKIVRRTVHAFNSPMAGSPIAALSTPQNIELFVTTRVPPIVTRNDLFPAMGAAHSRHAPSVLQHLSPGEQNSRCVGEVIRWYDHQATF